jgi:AcrR family transcriptional regulator
LTAWSVKNNPFNLFHQIDEMSPRTKEQVAVIRKKSRKNILDSAMKLFAQKGFENTSVSAIAREANISKGLIYNYFDTKEAIVEGIITDMIELANEITTPENPELPPKELLKISIDKYFDWLKFESQQTSWMLPMAFQVGKYPFVTELVAEKIKFTISNTAQIFTDLNYENPEQEAWFLGALFDGVAMDSALIANYDTLKMHTYILKKYNLL